MKLLAICLSVIMLLPGLTVSPEAQAQERSVSRGRAVTIAENLHECPGARITNVGGIIAEDGHEWIVPADTDFTTAPKAADLYNDCTGVRPAGMHEVDLETVPVIEVDAEGEVITALIFADNYFELYVNGRLVAADPVPYTPFNSSIVRFKASRPITYAVRMVDWEENLGLGTELMAGRPHHAGDGGFAASFSDGTVTDASWKAQVFYIAPLLDPAHVVEDENGRRTSAQAPTNPDCGENCYAVHYPLPENWHSPAFDDSRWPQASVYSNDTVGVDNKPAYTHFEPQFLGAGARFIWSGNLVLDNHVILRKRVP